MIILLESGYESMKKRLKFLKNLYGVRRPKEGRLPVEEKMLFRDPSITQKWKSARVVIGAVC